LQTQPVAYPVGIRLTSRAALDGAQLPDDIEILRKLAEQAKALLRSVNIAERISDDWGNQDFTVALDVLSDRANLAGVSNYDIAYSSALALNGINMTALRVGDKQIPVVTTLRLREKAQLSNLNNLYVYSSENTNKIPITQVTDINYSMRTSKIMRMGEFRTITVSAYPVNGWEAKERCSDENTSDRYGGDGGACRCSANRDLIHGKWRLVLCGPHRPAELALIRHTDSSIDLAARTTVTRLGIR